MSCLAIWLFFFGKLIHAPLFDPKKFWSNWSWPFIDLTHFNMFEFYYVYPPICHPLPEKLLSAMTWSSSLGFDLLMERNTERTCEACFLRVLVLLSHLVEGRKIRSLLMKRGFLSLNLNNFTIFLHGLLNFKQHEVFIFIFFLYLKRLRKEYKKWMMVLIWYLTREMCGVIWD